MTKSLKTILSATVAMALGCGTAMAEGYQVNTLSTKQLGMGHTGVALKLGSESMYFNPAGLGFLDKTLDLSASVTGIQPTCTATIDGKKYETDCDMSTPMQVAAAFKIYPNLSAGIAFYTPYGSSINWTNNWPGSVLNQEVNLKVFTIQPTFAWRPIEKLSIGAGLTMSWGTVDLNKGLVNAPTFDTMLGLLQATGQIPGFTPFGETCPASVNLKGTTKMSFGFNVGALYEVSDKVNVGASFRSRTPMRVKAGDAKISYANELAEGVLESRIGVLNQAQFTAMMPCPWVLSMGASYKPIDKLTLAFDARLTGWHTYQQLNIEFLSEQLEGFNQNIQKHYKNAWCFSVGGQYAVTKRFDARLGLMIDTTPVRKEYYNPETPGMTKIEPTVGLSFRPVRGLSIDLAFMYIHGCGAKGATCEYDDLIAKQINGMSAQMGMPMNLPETAKMTADYKLHAFAPSIGVSYAF